MMSRKLFFISVLSMALLLTGCKKIHTYSDSILKDSSWIVRDQINIEQVMGASLWQAFGGTTITGAADHSIVAAVASQGNAAFDDGYGLPPDVAVFSFGTNDVPNTPMTTAQKNARTDLLIDQSNFLSNSAIVAGANCIIWVLPNPEMDIGSAAFQENASYILTRFNDYRRDRKGTYSAYGFTWKEKFIDWGTRAQTNPGNLKPDGVHPNASGETWLGNQLHSKVGFCPDPD